MYQQNEFIWKWWRNCNLGQENYGESQEILKNKREACFYGGGELRGSASNKSSLEKSRSAGWQQLLIS